MVDPPDYGEVLAGFPELRSREGWGALGLPLTSRSDEAARLLDLAFRAAFTRSAPRSVRPLHVEISVRICPVPSMAVLGRFTRGPSWLEACYH
jgi:hypothetical protein